MAFIVPPVPNGQELSMQQFLEVLRREANTPSIRSLTTDPGTSGVPTGTWAVWKNTTSGLVKVWANDNGVMKSVTLT